jgi:hypothetical protein
LTVSKFFALYLAPAVTGYSIVEAESHDDAARMFADHPHLQIAGVYIGVLAVTPIPGI